MNRWLLMIAVALVALTVVAVAQPGGPADAKPAPMHMQGGGMMGGMMGQGSNSVAAWDGYIYILQGETLTKLSHDFMEIKSIELTMPHMPARDMQPRAGKDDGRMMKEGDKPGPMGGGGMMPGGMQAGMGMMQGRNAQLAADAKGVYLLRAGRVTVYDHDLNQIASTQIGEPRAGMAGSRGMMHGGMMQGGMGMMQGKMQQSGMQQDMMCPMMPGRMCPMMAARRQADGLNTSSERSIESGSVTASSLWVYPRQASVHLDVRDADGAVIRDASISAFMYPKGKPHLGGSLQVYIAADVYMVTCEFPEPGDYELALRVKRSGQADSLIYYDLGVR